jgi:hypothetical protein
VLFAACLSAAIKCRVAATKVVATNNAIAWPGPLLGKLLGCGAGFAVLLGVLLVPEELEPGLPDELPLGGVGEGVPEFALFGVADLLLGDGLVLVGWLVFCGAIVVGVGPELLDTR